MRGLTAIVVLLVAIIGFCVAFPEPLRLRRSGVPLKNMDDFLPKELRERDHSRFEREAPFHGSKNKGKPNKGSGSSEEQTGSSSEANSSLSISSFESDSCSEEETRPPTTTRQPLPTRTFTIRPPKGSRMHLMKKKLPIASITRT